MSTIKLKIDLTNGLVELEGSEEFARTELAAILDIIRTNKKTAGIVAATAPSENESPRSAEGNSVVSSEIASPPSVDLGGFLEKVNPDTQHEIVVTFAYYCALIDKAHGAEFKNNEVVSLFTGVFRRANPSEPSKLCANCYNEKKWIRPGAKRGYWQLSESGQKFIEGKLAPAAT